MSEAGGAPARLPGLDTLRALAILMVIPRHAGEFFHWSAFWLVAQHGWAGVDLFFVLSGFLIGSQLLRTAARDGTVHYGRFYLKRSLRILPAFYVVLLLYYVWPAFIEREPLEPWWRYAFFLMNFGWAGKALSHAWSLCIEEHFYLAVPLLVAAYAGRRPRLSPALLFAAVILGGMALRFAVWTTPGHFSRDIYRPTYCHLDGLAVGLGLALLRERRPEHWARFVQRPGVLVIVGSALVGAGLFAYSVMTQAGATLCFSLVGFGFGALVAAALAPGFWLAERRVPGAALIAALSYSLYLTHKQMIHLALTLVADPREDQWVAALYAVPLVALAGCVLHFLVERPGLKLRDRLLALRP